MSVRKAMVLAVLAGFLGAPVARAVADEETAMERTPAASDSTTTKHKKKKKKKPAGTKKKSKKHSAHSAGAATKSHGKTHAPKASAMPSAPQYPTQSGAGAGGFSDIPNEKKDDLPPPAPVKD